VYDLHLSVSKLSTKFSNATNGTYEFELLIGDSFISSSFRWVVAKANITFDAKSHVSTRIENPFTPQPPIEHQFRPAALRAPEYMSNIFTILVIVPIAVLIIGILRVGGNFSNIPRGGLLPIYALLFVGGIGLLFGLIVVYWYQLKLFVALGYGLTIGIPTIFFGNQVLHYYAQLRDTKKQKNTIKLFKNSNE